MATKLRQFAGLLMRPLQIVAYAISGLVPRDPRRWVFGTWGGHRYADNAAALFEHLAAEPVAGVRTTWITRRRNIRDELRSAGHRAHLPWSPGGIWASVRAGVFIYDSIPKDVNFWLSRNAMLVLLRHGIGIKKIERGIDVPDHRLYKLFHGTSLQRMIYGLLLPSHLAVPDLVVACSEEHARQGMVYFGVDREALEITGFPRHDRLAECPEQNRASVPCIGDPVPADQPLFLFLPTFREGLGRRGFDWPALADAAEACGVTIAVKFHVVDTLRGVIGLDQIEAAPNLRLVEPTIDPVEWYAHADGLLTDFSSAAFDFMLLRRPIVYFVPDLDDFRATRPLMLELDEVAAGPICQNGEELAEALRATVDDTDTTRTEELIARFYDHEAGGASARVTAAILDRLGLEPAD